MRMVSKFKVRLAEKEVQEKRSISLSTVAAETRISIYTVTGFANNTLKEIPVDALVALADYLKCGVGDILEIVPESRTPDHAVSALIAA